MSIFDRLYNNKSESTFKAKFYRDMALFEDCSLSLNESLAYQTVSLLAVSYIPKNFFFFWKATAILQQVGCDQCVCGAPRILCSDE